MIQRPYDFPRPDAVAIELKTLFGDGLISSEGIEIPHLLEHR